MRIRLSEGKEKRLMFDIHGYVGIWEPLVSCVWMKGTSHMDSLWKQIPSAVQIRPHLKRKMVAPLNKRLRETKTTPPRHLDTSDSNDTWKDPNLTQRPASDISNTHTCGHNSPKADILSHASSRCGEVEL